MLDNVLILCHGRIHRPIKEVNMLKAILIDADENVNPDYTLSLDDEEFADIVGKNFDYVIDASCPHNLLCYDETLIHNAEGDVVDGDLDIKTYNNIWNILNNNGYFYTFSRFLNSDIYKDKLYQFGFKYFGEKKLTFDKDEGIFDLFIKIKKPSFIDILQYFYEIIEMGRVKYCTVSVMEENNAVFVNRYYIKTEFENFKKAMMEDQIIYKFTYTTLNDETVILFQ